MAILSWVSHYTFETSETRSLWLDLKQYHSLVHGVRTLREEIAFTAQPKFTPTPKFSGTAEAYCVCHIGPIFQISLINAFMTENKLKQVYESPMSGLSKKFLWISWSNLLKTRQDKPSLGVRSPWPSATGELVRPKMVTINSLLCIKAYGRWHRGVWYIM